MSSQGPNGASTFSQTGAGDTTTNLSNLSAEDGATADADLSGVGNTKLISITNFGFTIPSGATINGIVVEVKRKRVDLGGQAKDNIIQLILGGTAQGDNKASSTAWPTSLTYVTYGSSSDLWSLTPSYSDINASNFGLEIKARDLFTSDTISIDYVRITVYYTSAATASVTISTSSAVTPKVLKDPKRTLTSSSSVSSTLKKTPKKPLIVSSPGFAMFIRRAKKLLSLSSPVTSLILKFPKRLFSSSSLVTSHLSPIRVKHANFSTSGSGSASLTRTAGKLLRPHLLLLDNFTDADRTQITSHFPDVGPQWQGTGVSAIYTIESNQLINDDFVLRTIFSPVDRSDVELYVDVVAISPLTVGMSLKIRYKDQGNFWEFFYDYPNGWQLDLVLSGADNFIGSPLPGSTGTVSFKAVGNQIVATGPNGDSITTISSIHRNETQIGLAMRSLDAPTTTVDRVMVIAATGAPTFKFKPEHTMFVQSPVLPSIIRIPKHIFQAATSSLTSLKTGHFLTQQILAISSSIARVKRMPMAILLTIGSSTATLIRYAKHSFNTLATGVARFKRLPSHVIKINSGIISFLRKKPVKPLATSSSVTSLFKRRPIKNLNSQSSVVPKFIRITSHTIKSTVITFSSIVRKPKKLLAIISLGITIIKETAERSFATTASSITKLLKKPVKLLKVQSSGSAAISEIRRPARVLFASSTSLSSIVKKPAHKFLVISVGIPILIRKTSHKISTTSSNVVNLIIHKVKVISTSALSNPIARLKIKPNKVLRITSPGLSKVSYRIMKLLRATAGSLAFFAHFPRHAVRAVAVVIPTFVRRVSHRFTVVGSSQPIILKKPARRLIATTFTLTTLLNRPKRTMLTTSGAAAKLIKRPVKKIKTTSIGATVISTRKVIAELIAVIVVGAAKLLRRPNKQLPAQSTGAVMFFRKPAHKVSTTSTGVIVIRKSPKRTITISSAITSRLLKRAGHVIKGTSAITSVILKQPRHKVVTTSIGVAFLRKRSPFKIHASSTGTVSLKVRIGKLVRALPVGVASLKRSVKKRILAIAVGLPRVGRVIPQVIRITSVGVARILRRIPVKLKTISVVVASFLSVLTNFPTRHVWLSVKNRLITFSIIERLVSYTLGDRNQITSVDGRSVDLKVPTRLGVITVEPPERSKED